MPHTTLIWEKVASNPGPELPLFRARIDLMRHPRTAQTFERLVLESVDWVNVVAVTAGGRAVMVDQYRFGVGGITTEPAAGLVDRDEDPLTAAKRELLEETGYGGGNWRYLGAVQPNPAYHNNLCHHWLAEDVLALQPPKPEGGEAIQVRLMTLEEIRAAVASGRLRHTLALSALSRVYPLWELPYTHNIPEDNP